MLETQVAKQIAAMKERKVSSNAFSCETQPKGRGEEERRVLTFLFFQARMEFSSTWRGKAANGVGCTSVLAVLTIPVQSS